jgi:hypothetical protein
MLIHREDRDGGIRLYFVTAGSLFRTADGNRLPPETSIAVGSGVDRLVVDDSNRTRRSTPAARADRSSMSTVMWSASTWPSSTITAAAVSGLVRRAD